MLTRAYDAVGNRKTYTATITQTTVITYHYPSTSPRRELGRTLRTGDAADRLLNAGGVAYTWDHLGRLLDDGARSYAWDAAGRLISVTLGDATTLFGYNGDGDRLSKTVNGTLTTYTLDVAAGLPQVLVEHSGENATLYLYGLDLIGEQGAAWAYHLNDGLGSVRQLVDGPGQVTLAQGARPFGGALWQAGSGSSGFGYTGEQVDASTGLVFLRARYYAPLTGRFISRDPFPGYVQLPQTQNRYIYVINRPTQFIDPSGLDWQNPTMAEGIAIHKMIGFQYQMEASARGRWVETEVLIPGAKKQSDVTRLYWLARNFCMRLTRDPESPFSFGRADILDYTLREVYEIKPRGSWVVGQADAIWYTQALNTLPEPERTFRGFGPPNWRPGTSYPTSKRYIGPWPTDPEAQVWAERVSDAVGVIGYWGTKKQEREPRRLPDLKPVPVPDGNPLSIPENDDAPQPALAPRVAEATGYAIVTGAAIYIGWKAFKGAVGFFLGGPLGAAAGIITP